jgi:nitric oxide reductase large subunit
MAYKKMWIALGFALVISFTVLGGVGLKVIRSPLPIPEGAGADNGSGIL